MKGSSTRKIVVAGVMSAIVTLLGATRWGFIPWFAGTSFTIMHVPVIIGAVLEGPVVGLVVGLIYGLFSLVQGVIARTNPADPWFVNPLIFVLPRLFIGPFAWAAYRVLEKRSAVLAPIVSGILGSVINSALVPTMIGLLGYTPWSAIGTTAVISGVPEAVVAAIVLSVFDRPARTVEGGPTS